MASVTARLAEKIVRVVLAFSCALAAPIAEADTGKAPQSRHANFGNETASDDARLTADWIVDSGDSQGLPFVIVDKKSATVLVFQADGQLIGATSALIGLARGDDAVPGIGERKLSAILPAERTTPAGRFVAALGRNLKGEEVLWVDYDGAISLHRVHSNNSKERRLWRLASTAINDKRITYGCINVPVAFYTSVIGPTFAGSDGVVYVLPETRTVKQVFASYDVDQRARQQFASQSVPTGIAFLVDTYDVGANGKQSGLAK